MSKTKLSLRKFNPEPIATAIQKLATAASGHYGNDCYLHAMLAQRALKELAGIQTKIVIGFAAWRVGEGDGDVISHMATPDMIDQGSNKIPYHAWLVAGDYLFDFSTYQLRDKARQLDALDGGLTQVDWCPDYLIVKQKKISSFNHVQRLGAGLFFYEQSVRLERKLKDHSQDALDEEDWQNFLLVYANPGVVVRGPNHLDCAEDDETASQAGLNRMG